MRNPRCYMEFCCNPATIQVRDYGNPPTPEFTYRGQWGWCTQHKAGAR